MKAHFLMDTKVTIGLPCYNSVKTLALAITSILAQTYIDWRLIIIDDGSTDNTRALAEKFSAFDPRIELITHTRNRGLATCLNEISFLARTDLLFRMDADDVMFPNRLAEQVTFMAENSDCDLLGTAIVSIDTNQKVKAIRKPPEMPSRVADIFTGEVIYHPTLCGRTQWFESNRYNEKLQVSEDFELLARTAGRTKIQNLSSPLLFYREYDSFTYQKYRDQSKVTRNVILQYGPQKIGMPQAYSSWLQRRVKDLIYFSFNSVGLWQKSLNLHNQLLSGKTKDEYQQILDNLYSA